MQSAFIGNFQLDDYLNFALNARLESGASAGSFTPSVYDVIEMGSAGAPSEVASDQALTNRSTILNTLYTPTTPIQLTTGNGYEEGKVYAVLVKSGTGTTPTSSSILYFKIDFQASIIEDTELLIDVETSDAAAEGSGVKNTVIGRLRTLELNQQGIIFPRLKRILGRLGEHAIADGFTYDEDGNITSYRERHFDTAANRDAASIWVSGDDPAPTLQTGELVRYSVTVSNSLPRNLRSSYQSVIDSDQADNDFIDTSDGSWI